MSQALGTRRPSVLIAVVSAATSLLVVSCSSSQPGLRSNNQRAACTPTRGAHGAGDPGAGPPSLGKVTLGPGMSVERSAETLAKAAGPLLRISGRVYDATCRPMAGAVIQVWQANADGEYGPGHGTEQLRCCYLQGAVETEAGGRYEINTVMPGHYRGDAKPPPAHIHLSVSHPGAQSLSTELDFAGDPYLPSGATPVIALHGIDGGLQGTFDIVLTAN